MREGVGVVREVVREGVGGRVCERVWDWEVG